MYTDCPDCQRQFHIYATQIAAARGLVKCGFCGAQFNALERLRDKPRIRSKPETPVSSNQQPLPEPEFIIPDVSPEQAPGQTPATTRAIPGTPEPGPGRFGVTSGILEQDVTAHAGSNIDSRIGPALTARSGNAVKQPALVASAAVSVSGLNRPVSFEFSPALNEQPVPKSVWISRTFWAAGILILMVFASTQVIWFNRDTIMSHYPVTVPWFNRLCASIDCTSIRHRDLAAIQLLNRDVREHPRYQNALLVNATMSNQSHTIQPYPVVQLNLFDTDGNLIAYRQFQPREYLDESINITQGMTPNLPVHFVLEVLDSAVGAVSFEFEFH